MRRRMVVLLSLAVLICLATQAVAQNSSTRNGSAVPKLISYSGVLKDASNRAITSTTGITFLIYKDEQGGAPLWMETQNVNPDHSGHYTVQLGAANAHGLPSDIFQNGEARWLAVQVSGESEQARSLLVSVPYALKAGDAETIGGLPPSAFLRSTSEAVAHGSGPGDSPQATNKAVKTAPPYGTANFVPLWTNVNIIQNSTLFQSGAGNVGIGTTSPVARLDVNGAGNFSGLVNSSGYDVGGALFAFGSFANGNGFVGFAGNTSMTGGSNTAHGYAALQSDTTGDSNTAIGYRALIRNLDGYYNTATGAQTLTLNTSGYNNVATGNYALSSNSTGYFNNATGAYALNNNTTGFQNTADGRAALYFNTTGSNNTGLGNHAGGPADNSNVTGSSNTFIGAGTAPSTGSLSNTTAIGANAEVTASNSLVLGSINGINSATADTNVGIGTTAPATLLHVDHKPAAGGQDIVLITSGKDGNVASLLLQNTGPGLRLRHGVGTDSAYIASSGTLQLITADTGTPNSPGTATIIMDNSRRVGIGGNVPSHPLHMSDGAYEDGGTWHNNSDRNLKANFKSVNGSQLLSRLNHIPVMTWNYKTDDRSVRHLGPMAQDFHAVFGLDGKDDTHISTLDEGGVALAGVQELYRMILKKDKEIRNLEQLTREKDAQLQKLAAEVERLHTLEQAVQILSTKMTKIESAQESGAEILRASK